MTPNSSSLFTVTAEADPQLPGRILDLFAQRNLLPDFFAARRVAAGLRVTARIADLDAQAGELMARKMLNIPTVLEVKFHARA